MIDGALPEPIPDVDEFGGEIDLAAWLAEMDDLLIDWLDDEDGES